MPNFKAIWLHAVTLSVILLFLIIFGAREISKIYSLERMDRLHQIWAGHRIYFGSEGVLKSSGVD